MANALVSDSVLEALVLPNPIAEVSDSALEVLADSSPPSLVSESVLEVIIQPGTITVVKNTVFGDGSFHFSTTGGGPLPANFTLTTIGGAASITFDNVPLGVYTVTELDPGPTWKFSSLSVTPPATSLGRVATINLVAGDIIFTFIDSLTPRPGIGSSPSPLFTCPKINLFDRCLYEEMVKFAGLRIPPSCTMPERFRHLLPWDDEAVALPHQAVPFHAVKGLLTPAPASGDKVVVSLTVPMGYDGFLTGAFWSYSGQGFVQGSGDILWRIQINQRYVKDISNIPFSMGSPQLPLALTEGQILLCGQTVRGVVNVPNLSGLIQVGASQIAFGLIGFFWPRGMLTGEACS